MTSSRKKILLTNDDGINSPSLVQLYEELSRFAEVTVITPNIERSAEGKAITINQILRVEKVSLQNDQIGYTITGTSTDAIIFGLNSLEEAPFDFVVAGINLGLNISSHVILSSGTCAAALEASFYGLPAIAFSMDVTFYDTPRIALSMDASKESFSGSSKPDFFKDPAKIAAKVVKNLLQQKYPEGLAFLNVNFPSNTTLDSPIQVTSLAPKFIKFKPEKRKDPRNNDYYFLWGKPVTDIPKGSDVEAIVQGKISITPICSDMTLRDSFSSTFLEELLSKFFE